MNGFSNLNFSGKVAPFIYAIGEKDFWKNFALNGMKFGFANNGNLDEEFSRGECYVQIEVFWYKAI